MEQAKTEHLGFVVFTLVIDREVHLCEITPHRELRVRIHNTSLPILLTNTPIILERAITLIKRLHNN